MTSAQAIDDGLLTGLTPAERDAIERHRAAGVDDTTIGVCLAHDRIDELIDRHRDLCRHIVVACMPKSASTYFCRALVNVTGFAPYLLNTAAGDTERNIDRASIPMFLRRDTVSQEHMRATASNVTLLRRMGIRPVVLVRDIFDVIVSACDHGEREHGSGPAAHMPPDFARWSRDERLWFIVRMGTPWFLSLVTSWIDAAKELDCLWVTYDEATGRTAAAVAAVLRHVGVAADQRRLAAGIAATAGDRTRFNRGQPGRGRTELTPAHRAAVREIAASHRGRYDLSKIGLQGGAACTG